MSYVILRVILNHCVQPLTKPALCFDPPFKPYYFIFENFSYAKGDLKLRAGSVCLM